MFRGHVVRVFAAQLVGLAALEAASILLLLAELGFIGVFVSGGVYFVDDQGPVLPVRDRAAEWGQMLAGAQYYTFSRQWIAFVPALFVALLVASCNLFGEGIRVATDHRDTTSHRGCCRCSPAPRSRGPWSSPASGSRPACACSHWTSTTRCVAQTAAARLDPSAVLVAAVVRLSSSAHGLETPEKLNVYFRMADGTLTRVGFPDADGDAQEPRPFSDEDGISALALAPLRSTALKLAGCARDGRGSRWRPLAQPGQPVVRSGAADGRG